jgi:hypothetical protein
MLVAGCGSDTDAPAPSDATPSATQDAVATTADPLAETAGDDPDADVQTQTSTADAEPTPTATAGPTTAGPTTASPVAPTSEAPPARPAVSSCTDDALSQDILGFTGGVSVFFCEGDWAYAAYPNAPGAPEFIGERVGGRWFNAVAIGDPVCQDDLLTRGAPPAIAKLLPPCGEAPAPPAPPAPTQPEGPCVVNTDEYGDTHAELVQVTCAEATAEWELAEANAEPSWTIPWVTPSGWECFVTPYDPSSQAAGSCYGPDGSAYFTLYLP